MKKPLDESDPVIVKIYSSDDKILKQIGQVLSSEKSRKIYCILIEKELNAKEVAKLVDNEENPRLPNIIFHLDKMVDCGMLSLKKKQQRKNGHYLKYYKAVQSILVLPPQHYQNAATSKSLHKIIGQIFKLSSTGIIIGSALFMSEYSSFFETKINNQTSANSITVKVR